MDTVPPDADDAADLVALATAVLHFVENECPALGARAADELADKASSLAPRLRQASAAAAGFDHIGMLVQLELARLGNPL